MTETRLKTETETVGPADEAQFHQDIEPWLDSLIGRHGMDGRLGRLPYDPIKYPFQRLDIGIVPARIPSAEELEEMAASLGGKDSLYEAAFAKLHEKGYQAVGEQAYGAIVADLIGHRGGQTMREILERLSQPNRNVTILLAHANLQDIPFAQLVVLDALAQTAMKENLGLDIFDIIRQSYTYASETMTRLDWDGDPVIKILSGSANAVKVYPPTDSGVKLPVDRKVKRSINDRSRSEMDLENQRLLATGRSRLDYFAPAASSMAKVYDENKRLTALRPKNIPVVAAQSITEGSDLVLPIAIWFDKQMQLSWQILEPRKLADRTEFNDTMRELNEATAKLAGAELLEPERSAGVVASGEMATKNTKSSETFSLSDNSDLVS